MEHIITAPCRTVFIMNGIYLASGTAYGREPHGCKYTEFPWGMLGKQLLSAGKQLSHAILSNTPSSVDSCSFNVLNRKQVPNENRVSREQIWSDGKS